MCYICLEECDTKSPCRCSAIVHEECLKKVNQTNCTICKNRLKYPKVVKLEGSVEKMAATLLLILFTCCIYIIAGWVGKCFLIMFRPVDNFVAFWTPEHVACSFVVTIILALISKMFHFL